MPSFIKDTAEASMGSFDAGNPNMSEKGPPRDSNALTNPAAFRSPSCAEYLGDDDGDEMGFLNMLQRGPTASGKDDEPYESSMMRMPSIISRVSTTKSTASDFDFVKMDKSRNMLKLTNRQSLWPVAVVTIVFFLWGFAYGLLNVLNGQFQRVVGLSTTDTIGLHSAYWGGYFIAPLTLGRFILIRYGFKATMMAGLCVYGCGTLVFWPSAVLTSYPAFIVSNFIVGCGLACLEVAANPYTALCGPLEYAEVRLTTSQAFQAVGTVVSPLLAQKVLFKNLSNAPSLVEVQWAYLGIALFVFALAVAFYYIPLPEATDEQLEEQADRREAVYRSRVGPWPVIWVTLGLGAMAQACYVGAQEGVGNSAQSLMVLFQSDAALEPFDYVTVGHTVFAVGRFLYALLNYLVKPRWLLMCQFIGVTVMSGIQMRVTGTAAAGVLMALYFFESSIFPIIFAICMRGMGAHTKTASAIMTASISGGGIVPPIQWAASKTIGLPRSFSVLVAFFAFGTLFPIYLNLVPQAKNQVDPIHERGRRRRQPRRTNSTFSDPSSATREFGLKGIIARRKKKALLENLPASQHIERSTSNGIMTSSGGFDEKSVAVMEIPSPVHTSHSSGKANDLGPWMTSTSSSDSMRKDSRSASTSESSSRSGSGSPGKKTVGFGKKMPNQPRAWTEKDDAIDDYHNALKGI